MNLLKIFITAFLIDNVVILRFIALCPFIGMSSDEDKSVGMYLSSFHGLYGLFRFDQIRG